MEEIFLNTHYRLGSMVKLKEVIDMPKLVSFLHDKTPHAIVVVYTTHTLKKTPPMWRGPNWEPLVIGWLEAKATFKMVVYVCDHKSFKHMFTIVFKFIFVSKVWFEFGQYMVGVAKGTRSSKGPMEEWVFFYAYMFPCKIGTYIQNIFGTRKLLSLIIHLISSLPEDLCLYKYEILPKVMLKIMLPILHGDLVCFNIFGEG